MNASRFTGLCALLVAVSASCAFAQTLSFAGCDWTIKSSESPVGPGPNLFSRSAVRKSGRAVVLSAVPAGKDKTRSYYSAEIYSKEYFGYGTFELKFSLKGRLDRNAVFGFFLYDGGNPPGFSEADVELARWGIVDAPEAQFTVHPVRSPDEYFIFSLPDEALAFVARIVWTRGQVLMSLGAADGAEIARWTYAGAALPFSASAGEKVRVHCNVWLFEGGDPAFDGVLSVKLEEFRFSPDDGGF